MVGEMGRQITKPPKLSTGDTIGVIAPATPFTPRLPPAYRAQFARSVACLEGLGFDVHVPSSITSKSQCAYVSPEARAQEVNDLFAQPAIRAVIALVGGRSANALLPYLDWQRIAGQPKIILGYSAVSALLVGIHSRTGLVTYHGPMLLNGFGEFPSMLAYSRNQIENVLMNPECSGPCHPPDEWTTDYPRDDSPRALQKQKGWRWLRSGQSRGCLIGGNLATLCTLAGTPFWPSFKDAVLFLEEVKTGPSVLQEIDQSLAQLAMLGVFDEIKGLVVGKLNDATAYEIRMFDHLICRHTAAYDFPILSQVDLGHTDPKLTLPIGIHASLDSASKQFSLAEAAVSARAA